MSSRVSLLPKLLYVLFLYCVLFYPPFVVMGIRIYGYQIVRVVAVLYLLFNWNRFSAFYKRFSTIINLMCVIVFITIMRFLMGGEQETTMRNIIGIFTLIVIPFFIVDYGRRLKIDSIEKMTVYLLSAATMAVGISLLAFTIPSVNEYIREGLIQYGKLGYKESFEQRGFGWGLYMNSSYSFVLAMLTAIGLLYGKKSKWFIFVIPFALIACLINARTGIVIGIVGLVIYFFNSGKITYSLLVLIAGVLVYNNLLLIIEGLFGSNDLTYAWLMEGYQEGLDYSSGNFNSGTIGSLKRHIIFPDSILGWIIGEGESLFSANRFNKHSDIGFINQLFFGGVIYCFFLYLLVAKLCIRLSKCDQKPFSLFVLLTFFIVNFKGDFVFNTPELGLTMIVYFTILIYGSEKHNYYRESQTNNRFIMNK